MTRRRDRRRVSAACLGLLAVLWMYRPDARASVLLAIPILPYLYWQWRW